MNYYEKYNKYQIKFFELIGGSEFEIEKYVICPISQEIMVDPVIAEDGNTYERKNITQWLNSNTRSPMTNENMGNQLTPNRMVKSLTEFLITNNKISAERIEEYNKMKEPVEERVPAPRPSREQERARTRVLFELSNRIPRPEPRPRPRPEAEEVVEAHYSRLRAEEAERARFVGSVAI